MKPHELEFKSLIEVTFDRRTTYIPTLKTDINNAWNKILNQEFSQISPEFFEWIKLIPNIPSLYTNNDQIELWKNIIHYLNTDFEDEKKIYFQELRKSLIKFSKKDKVTSGAGLLSDVIADGFIVKNIYLSNNKELIDLFAELLPEPPASLFPKDRIPEKIRARYLESSKVIHDLAVHNSGQINKVENIAIKLQRTFRLKKRKKEERILIAMAAQKNEEELTDEQIDEILIDANSPYKPTKCSPELAELLLSTSKEIKLFETIRHLTATKAVTRILDNGLFGRKSLSRNYMPFRPAALYYTDILNGDADVICFAAFEIDPECMQSNTAELVIDMEKLSRLTLEEEHPTAFFKQRDLGFSKEKKRAVKIGETEVIFDHTSVIRCPMPGYSHISFFRDKSIYNDPIYVADLRKFQLISSNVREIHSILIMNFFKFLEQVDNPLFIKSIYDALEKLNPEELREVMLNIGKNISDTMEFNFYGSFLMNPALIKEINIFTEANKISHHLDMEIFISLLNAGDLAKLEETREQIPQLFGSYRFIEYLDSVIENPAIKERLQELKKELDLPLWKVPRDSIAEPSGERIAGLSAGIDRK